MSENNSKNHIRLNYNSGRSLVVIIIRLDYLVYVIHLTLDYYDFDD